MTAHVRYFCAGLLALVAATWKLWTPQVVFPQVPLLRFACEFPGWIDWICLTCLISSAVLMFLFPREGRLRQSAASLMAFSLAGLFLLDQHRLQPWAWQFFLLALLFALTNDQATRRGWRWLAIGIYFWSAVSKLDYTFFHEQGPALLDGLKKSMGLNGISNSWTDTLDVFGSVLIACGEMGIALFLTWPRTRWLGLWGAILMHLSLLAALGPLGLNHSLGVLLWNVFFIGQDLLLFGESMFKRTPRYEGFRAEIRAWWSDMFCEPEIRPLPLGLGILFAALIWPVFEPQGYCDHWLAWAVYSARTDTMTLDLGPEIVVHLPEDIATHVIGRRYIYERIDLNQWSLTALGVPIYPQSRFQTGVALSFQQFGNMEQTQLFVASLPYRFGWRRRTSIQYANLTEIKALADSFRFNAYPRMQRARHQDADHLLHH